MSGGRAILCLLVLGALLAGLFGASIPAPARCGLIGGCPLNAGVFAATGTSFAQAAFALVSLFLISWFTAFALFDPANVLPRLVRPLAVNIRPAGASQRKFSFWRSLKETSPTPR